MSLVYPVPGFPGFFAVVAVGFDLSLFQWFDQNQRQTFRQATTNRKGNWMAQIIPVLRSRSDTDRRGQLIRRFLTFLLDAQSELSNNLVPGDDPQVQEIRRPLEEHYLDDQGKPAMYQRLESTLYDDARSVVTLWRYFNSIPREQLVAFRKLLQLEHDGLTGDRHPRKIFDRSPFGIGALIVGTITIWMTVLQTFTGEDLSELLQLIRFNWVAGTVWIVGLFVAIWYILKTLRNNRQVALLSSIRRSLDLYLDP